MLSARCHQCHVFSVTTSKVVGKLTTNNRVQPDLHIRIDLNPLSRPNWYLDVFEFMKWPLHPFYPSDANFYHINKNCLGMFKKGNKINKFRKK